MQKVIQKLEIRNLQAAFGPVNFYFPVSIF